MADEPYEIVPYKEIASLKKQIDELKLRTGDPDYKALLGSVTSLTKSMEGMLNLFKTAAEEMKLEQKSEAEISTKIGPLTEKVETLMDQNKTIAESMVALADMVKELKDSGIKEEKPRMPEPSPFTDFDMPQGPPSMPRIPPRMPPGRMPPRMPSPPGLPPDLGGPISAPNALPRGPEPFPDFNEPFPPLEEPKKKGLFGMFKKK